MTCIHIYIYLYVYIYIYIFMYMYIYIFTYTQRTCVFLSSSTHTLSLSLSTCDVMQAAISAEADASWQVELDTLGPISIAPAVGRTRGKNPRFLDNFQGSVSVPMFHITQLLGINLQQIFGLVMWNKSPKKLPTPDSCRLKVETLMNTKTWFIHGPKTSLINKT